MPPPLVGKTDAGPAFEVGAFLQTAAAFLRPAAATLQEIYLKFIVRVARGALVLQKICAQIFAFAAARWRDRWRQAAREAAIDAAANIFAFLTLLRLIVGAAVAIQADPLDWARLPFPMRRGRERVEVRLACAASPAQLRLIAHFWRAHGSQSWEALQGLTARHFTGSFDPLDVSGVIVCPRTEEPPIVFRTRINFVERTATLLARETDRPLCRTSELSVPLFSPALEEILRPLLSRPGARTD